MLAGVKSPVGPVFPANEIEERVCCLRAPRLKSNWPRQVSGPIFEPWFLPIAVVAYLFLPLALPLPWWWATVTSTLSSALLPSTPIHLAFMEYTWPLPPPPPCARRSTVRSPAIDQAPASPVSLSLTEVIARENAESPVAVTPTVTERILLFGGQNSPGSAVTSVITGAAVSGGILAVAWTT